MYVLAEKPAGPPFFAGFTCPQSGKWRMQRLVSTTLTEARRERDAVIADLDAGRIVVRDGATFEQIFEAWLGERDLAERTRAHERHLMRRHLASIQTRRVQDISRSDLSALLVGMRRRGYSAWTIGAVHKICRGVLGLAEQDGVIVRSPAERLSRAVVPTQRNAKEARVLDQSEIAGLIDAAGSERWQAAIAIAAWGGLRLGELRALTWDKVDLQESTITVSGSLLPDGSRKGTKTLAGQRTVPILPALKRSLATWKLRSPHTRLSDFVVCERGGGPVEERNARRALAQAVERAGIEVADGQRLGWHALRHTALSTWGTDLALAPTTLAKLAGHSDPGFTFKKYARDARKAGAITEEVLTRAAAANVGA